MEISEAYEFLKQIRRINLKIKQLELRLTTLKGCLMPGAIDYSRDKVQASPSDKLADIMAEYMEIETQLENTNLAKYSLIHELTTTIDKLDNEMERAVLISYYVDGISMKKTANLVGYEISHTYRLRRIGVKHLSEIK